jgi:hypothetical protein
MGTDPGSARLPELHREVGVTVEIDPMWRDVEIARDGIDSFAGDGTEQMAAFERLMVDRVRLRDAIRSYIVAVSRAPNNRDETEIDDASRGLVEVMSEQT